MLGIDEEYEGVPIGLLVLTYWDVCQTVQDVAWQLSQEFRTPVLTREVRTVLRALARSGVKVPSQPGTRQTEIMGEDFESIDVDWANRLIEGLAA